MNIATGGVNAAARRQVLNRESSYGESFAQSGLIAEQLEQRVRQETNQANAVANRGAFNTLLGLGLSPEAALRITTLPIEAGRLSEFRSPNFASSILDEVQSLQSGISGNAGGVQKVEVINNGNTNRKRPTTPPSKALSK